MARMDDLFLPDRYAANKKMCDWELSMMSDEDIDYMIALNKSGIIVENECNSMVAYCIGASETPPERRVEYMSGELPDI